MKSVLNSVGIFAAIALLMTLLFASNADQSFAQNTEVNKHRLRKITPENPALASHLTASGENVLSAVIFIKQLEKFLPQYKTFKALSNSLAGKPGVIAMFKLEDPKYKEFFHRHLSQQSDAIEQLGSKIEAVKEEIATAKTSINSRPSDLLLKEAEAQLSKATAKLEILEQELLVRRNVLLGIAMDKTVLFNPKHMAFYSNTAKELRPIIEEEIKTISKNMAKRKIPMILSAFILADAVGKYYFINQGYDPGVAPFLYLFTEKE